MTASDMESTRGRLQNVALLAHLLQRLESAGAAVNADQYRSVVGKLKESLAEPLPQPALDAILAAHPAAAELYENLHYAVSGLCRSPLEHSVSAELRAAQTLARFGLPSRSANNG